MAKRRGLGRGLDALLGSVNTATAAAGTEQPATISEKDTLQKLPVDLVKRGRYQPRLDIDEEALEELANSIKAQGVVQPIVVRKDGREYEIIAGERRWRAAQLAGLSEIPAVVREVSDKVAMAIALIENIQRQELNPLEEALALNRLIEEYGMTHQQVAEAVGRSRTAVTNLLRLISLRDDVKEQLRNGDLEMGHARALLALEGNQQSDAARIIVDKEMSVREAEALVKKMQNPVQKQVQEPDPNIKRLEQDLSDRLGAGVSIAHQSSGKGKLVVTYNSLDELEGIIAHIK